MASVLQNVPVSCRLGNTWGCVCVLEQPQSCEAAPVTAGLVCLVSAALWACRWFGDAGEQCDAEKLPQSLWLDAREVCREEKEGLCCVGWRTLRGRSLEPPVAQTKAHAASLAFSTCAEVAFEAVGRCGR